MVQQRIFNSLFKLAASGDKTAYSSHKTDGSENVFQPCVVYYATKIVGRLTLSGLENVHRVDMMYVHRTRIEMTRSGT